MSKFFDWLDGRVAQMRALDIAALKLAVFLFTLFLVKLWPPILCLDWRWYLGLSFVVAVPVLFRFLEKRLLIALYAALWGAIYLAVEFLTKL